VISPSNELSLSFPSSDPLVPPFPSLLLFAPKAWHSKETLDGDEWSLFSMTEEPAECRAFLGRAAGANRKMCCRVGCRSRGSGARARARARADPQREFGARCRIHFCRGGRSHCGGMTKGLIPVVIDLTLARVPPRQSPAAVNAE